MDTPAPISSYVFDVLSTVTLEDIESRLAEIEGERAGLSLLRRSLLAKRRAEKRERARSITGRSTR